MRRLGQPRLYLVVIFNQQPGIFAMPGKLVGPQETVSVVKLATLSDLSLMTAHRNRSK
jgi:hypothetical protein